MKNKNYLVLLVGLICLAGMLLPSCAKKDDKPLNTGQRKQDDNQNGGSDQSRIISFSDYDWLVKSSGDHTVGPGPNYFSDSEGNVWVDDEGKLHLKIKKESSIWYNSEVTLLQSLGYGHYVFQIDSRIDQLDKNIVAAVFLYKNDEKELDNEFSKWGEDENENAQFAVQPSSKTGNKDRFNIQMNDNSSITSIIHWEKDFVEFTVYKGAIGDTTVDNIIKRWIYEGADIPSEEDDPVAIINLWMFKGQPPSDQKEEELVVSTFKYFRGTKDKEDNNGLNLPDSLQSYFEGENYYLLYLDSVLEKGIDTKVVEDYRVNRSNTDSKFIYFSNSFKSVSSDGLNPFGLPDRKWVSLIVNGDATVSWAAGSLENTGTTDFTSITDDYVLHFAIKSEEKDAVYLLRAGFGENNGDDPTDIGAKIYLGDCDNCYADFPRDGEWYHFNIPVSELKTLNPNFSFENVVDENAHLLDFSVDGAPDAGTTLDLGAIFYYLPKD